MSSYGEAEITVSARLVGKMRLLSIYPASAVYPRLGMGLGCTLHDNPTAEFAEGRPIEAFELRELAGELRLTEKGDTIGPIVWAGPRRYVRSSSYGSENQLDLMCDLDALRLERIEEHRDGGEPVLWLVLWPTLADQHGFLDADLHPIQVRIPRDRWLEFIAAVRDQRFPSWKRFFRLPMRLVSRRQLSMSERLGLESTAGIMMRLLPRADADSRRSCMNWALKVRSMIYDLFLKRGATLAGPRSMARSFPA